MQKVSIENKISNDIDFISIVNNILISDEFKNMKNIAQHGSTRYLHSLRVAHTSYKISKKLKLDYISTTRAALLHDFHDERSDNKCFKQKCLHIINHADVASIKSQNLFGINALEENIIRSHMFPFGRVIPKYKESFIVDAVDDIIATIEMGSKYKNVIASALGILVLLIKDSLL